MLLAGELKVARDEDEHAARGARGLAIDGGDGVLALLEGKRSELGNDVLRTLDLLAFEGQHGFVLVKRPQISTVRVERRVVVLHECLRHRIWIHLRRCRRRCCCLGLTLTLAAERERGREKERRERGEGGLYIWGYSGGNDETRDLSSLYLYS